MNYDPLTMPTEEDLAEDEREAEREFQEFLTEEEREFLNWEDDIRELYDIPKNDDFEDYYNCYID